jgi:signal transduction histidine kinase
VTNSSKTRRVYIAFGFITALYVLGLALYAVFVSMGAPSDTGDLIFTILTFTFPFVGFLICRRQPRNTVGWILLAIGFAWIVPEPLYAYAEYALELRPGTLAGGAVAAALTSWTWVPPVGLMGTFLLLLFPNGRLLSPRWRIVGWLSVIAMIGSSLAIVFGAGELEEEGFPGVNNPLHIPALAGLFEIMQLFLPLIAISIIASAVSLAIRFRRSRGLERLQLKWLTTAAVILAVVYAIALGGSFGHAWDTPTTPLWVSASQQAASICFFLIPISIGIAILRHRLFDIDIVVNKALVYGALAAFISAIYVGIVVGIGTLIGAGDEPNLGLSLAATAIVAVAFQPIRQRIQRFANRLVYGQRLSPYEAVTEFSERIATSLSFEEILPRMAEAAAKGVGGTRAAVTMFLPGGGRRSAFYPDGEQADSFDRTLTVIHQGESVGEISVAKEKGEQINSAEEKLLSDLASQAGLAMRNLRLTAELQQKLVEIQRSRTRIIEAQDVERRRMERDINEGAQRQLLIMAERITDAKSALETDSAQAEQLLEELKGETTAVVESVRDLARGIFPPLLSDRGLGPALESFIQKMNIPATLDVASLNGSRFDRESESVVYFCIREALTNAVKHAPGAAVSVRISTPDGSLAFEVSDQGSGFDPAALRGIGLQNMADRLEALGGNLLVESGINQGTVVSGRVPARALQAVR